MKTRLLIIWISRDHIPPTPEEYNPDYVEYETKVFRDTFSGLLKAKRSLAARVARSPVEWGKVYRQVKASKILDDWENTECLHEI